MSSPAVLITIPLSHYCEKARWALDRAGLSYREEPHAPLFNRLAGNGRARGTVPVLLHEGVHFVESTAILEHADKVCGGGLLYPRDAVLRSEVATLVARFDAELGPQTRRWAYSHLLSQAPLLREVWARGVPRREAVMIPVIAPLARFLARKAYRITPESARRSLDRILGVFREVEERLGGTRQYLVGECFTAADLTFAALAAPMLFPAECRATHPALDDVPAAMREEIMRLRDTGAGRFALRLFAQERGLAQVAESHEVRRAAC